MTQTGLEGLNRRRHGGRFQTVLSLSLSKTGCLVFNFRGRSVRAVGSLCLLFAECSGPSMCALPRLATQATAPGAARGGAVPLCMAVLCVGKDFKKQLTK